MSKELTRKELDIVQRIADGEKLASVAGDLHLNYAYLRNRLSVIREKMRCDTTYNVIAQAIRQGLID
jgi:DNA-binding NarL/FixJ family response regulator